MPDLHPSTLDKVLDVRAGKSGTLEIEGTLRGCACEKKKQM